MWVIASLPFWVIAFCAMVISLPSAGMLRHHRSRFLAAESEGFWVEALPAERALIDELIVNQVPATISFNTSAVLMSPQTTRMVRSGMYIVR